ncbi:hypothetical protein J6590_020256 [Homalodisca vitripennis]|nr:hypothetical protein J6590_020256 [Homalodisca vitripennis]
MCVVVVRNGSLAKEQLVVVRSLAEVSKQYPGEVKCSKGAATRCTQARWKCNKGPAAGSKKPSRGERAVHRRGGSVTKDQLLVVRSLAEVSEQYTGEVGAQQRWYRVIHGETERCIPPRGSYKLFPAPEEY